VHVRFAATDSAQETAAGGGGAQKLDCDAPCGSPPWVQITPRRFMMPCDDAVNLKRKPSVPPIQGCMPGRPGEIAFHAGGWELESECSFCDPKRDQPPTDASIQIGYIQTVESAIAGGVYFKKVANQWTPVDRDWLEAKNKRDCLAGAKEPWYGPKGSFGPQAFGVCPRLFDNPYVVLDTHKGEGVLRRMRIDGKFHTWLVAIPPSKRPVFIHHWTIEALAVAVLPDDADPCNTAAWRVIMADIRDTAKGQGQGQVTPVLGGDCANVTHGKQKEETKR
jgi:hypothetical protein